MTTMVWRRGPEEEGRRMQEQAAERQKDVYLVRRLLAAIVERGWKKGSDLIPLRPRMDDVSQVVFPR